MEARARRVGPRSSFQQRAIFCKILILNIFKNCLFIIFVALGLGKHNSTKQLRVSRHPARRHTQTQHDPATQRLLISLWDPVFVWQVRRVGERSMRRGG